MKKRGRKTNMEKMEIAAKKANGTIATPDKDTTIEKIDYEESPTLDNSYDLISMSQVYLCSGDSAVIEVAVDSGLDGTIENAKGIIVMNRLPVVKEPIFLWSTYCKFGEPFKVRVTNLNTAPKRINKGDVIGLCLLEL